MPLNSAYSPILSPIESYETLKTSRLNPFYCTRCGTYHDAVTPCPRFSDDLQNKHSYFYEMYNIDKSRSSHPSNVESCRISFPSVDNDDPCTCQKLMQTTSKKSETDALTAKYLQKCVSFDIKDDEECPQDTRDQCLTASSSDKDLKCLDVTQGTQTVCTTEQGTDSFDNDYAIFENFGWCSVHERLHGAGVTYPYGKFVLPAITEIEEEEILTNKNPPGPWCREGEIYRKKILKLTYPPQTKAFHKKCKSKYSMKKKPVPAWMGWLWNVEPDCHMPTKYKIRPEWRPGAMNFRIAKMIKQHRGGYEEIEKPKRKPKKKKRDDDEDVRPMIIIMKRQGCYLITMNPVPNPYDEIENQEDCAPIHFIVDQRKQRVEKVKEKKKCACNCDCDSLGESTKDLEGCCVSDETSESDDDEFELEFTPPICLVDHELVKKKQNLTEIGTQTEQVVAAKPKGKKK